MPEFVPGARIEVGLSVLLPGAGPLQKLITWHSARHGSHRPSWRMSKPERMMLQARQPGHAGVEAQLAVEQSCRAGADKLDVQETHDMLQLTRTHAPGFRQRVPVKVPLHSVAIVVPWNLRTWFPGDCASFPLLLLYGLTSFSSGPHPQLHCTLHTAHCFCPLPRELAIFRSSAPQAPNC